MNTITLIAAFVIMAAALAALVLIRKRGSATQSRTPYIDALHLKLEGRNDEAIAMLKRAVKADTSNITAYIILGDLFREKGNPSQAAKVHSNLLMRSDLSETQTATILHHLVLDHRAAGMQDKAIETAERLARKTKKNLDNQQLLLSLYEAKGDWDKAFFYRQSLNKWLKNDDQDILALYKVEAGHKAVARGTEREGRIRYREATKLHKGCIPAYLNWGDSYRRENRDEDAARIWEECTQKNPEQSHLLFDRLKNVLFDLRRYSDIEGIFERIIAKNPKNPIPYLDLADLYRNQGRYDQALELCQTVIDEHPEEPKAWYILTQIRQQKGDEAAALEEALEGLNIQIKRAVIYRCSQCGNTSDEPLWHCPECHAWNTYVS